MLHTSLQNNSLINSLLDWWDSLASITGLTPTWMLIITCLFIAIMVFFSGSVFAMFTQSLLSIFKDKDANDRF